MLKLKNYRDFGNFELDAFCSTTWLGIYEDQGVDCGGLSEKVPARLMHLNICSPIWTLSRNIRSSSVGEGITVGRLWGFKASCHSKGSLPALVIPGVSSQHSTSSTIPALPQPWHDGLSSLWNQTLNKLSISCLGNGIFSQKSNWCS